MANAKIETKTIKHVVLELSEAEAGALRTILGNTRISCNNETGLFELYSALDDAQVPRNPKLDNFTINTRDQYGAGK
jgi:hypothetical protein